MSRYCPCVCIVRYQIVGLQSRPKIELKRELKKELKGELKRYFSLFIVILSDS